MSKSFDQNLQKRWDKQHRAKMQVDRDLQNIMERSAAQWNLMENIVKFSLPKLW